MRRQLLSRSLGPLAALAALGMLCSSAVADGKVADNTEDRPRLVTTFDFDPEARQVELFEAMDKGEVKTKLLARDALGGNLLVENTTDETLTVKMPESFVGIHVHKQFGGGGMGMGGGMGGMGGGMMGGMGGGMGGMGGGMGGGQSMGGGMGGMGGGMMGGGGMGMGGGMGGGMMGGGGGGFFSIPSQAVARVPYQSVCLNYGRPEPTSRMTYAIVPTDEYTQDETLQALIGMVGTGQLNPQVAQAAAWHLTDDMSWQQLLTLRRAPGIPYSKPYFAPQQVLGARNLVSIAGAKARKLAEAEKSGEEEKIPSRVVQQPIR